MWQWFLLAGFVFAILGWIELKKDANPETLMLKKDTSKNPPKLTNKIKTPSKITLTNKNKKISRLFSNVKIFKNKNKEEDITKLPAVSVQGNKYSFKPIEPNKEEKKIQYIKLHLQDEETKKKQEMAKQRLKLLESMEEEARKKEEEEKFRKMKKENIQKEREKRWKEHYIVQAVKNRFSSSTPSPEITHMPESQKYIEEKVDSKEEVQQQKVDSGSASVFHSLLAQREAFHAESIGEERENPEVINNIPASPVIEEEKINDIRDNENKTTIEENNEEINDSTSEVEQKEEKEDILSFFANKARENKKEFDPTEMFNQL